MPGLNRDAIAGRPMECQAGSIFWTGWTQNHQLKKGTINMSGWAVERWDPLTAHIDVCSKQSLIWAVGEIPKNCGFFLPLILMIAFSKH